MTDSNLYRTFEQDTKKFINQINSSLIKLENSGYSIDEINQVFRCVHSIKSEAAYLNFDEISDKAHKMESVIEPLRNVGTDVEVDPALLEFCFSTIDTIGTLAEKEMNTVNKADDESDDFEAHLEEISPEDSGEEGLKVENLPYSEFELMLLKEARGRGERLYSLSFGISDDESMKYPRAYLALSNLEQKTNVIKLNPEVEEIDKSEDGRMRVILTSSKSEAAIAALVNIDQITNIEINELSFKEQLKNIPVENQVVVKNGDISRERVVSVEADEIDALSEYVSEIKKRLSDLSLAVEGSVDDKLSYDLAGIETISDSIEKMMLNLQTVDFNTQFAGYKRTARDLAAQLGKKAELIFEEDNIRIPREFADFIAEPMLQIIRNAVVHGIEEPSVRIEEGKTESGIINVKALKNSLSTVIIISDDGCGVDEEAVFAALDSIDGENPELLEILSRPGFTTLSESGHFAGRGVGLDLVKNRITTRGGQLEMTNVKGLGCEFRIIISDESDIANFLVVDSDDIVCAVEIDNDSVILEITSEKINCVEGSCYFNGLQLFTANGRLILKPEPQNRTVQAIKLKHLGKKALLLFNESLFEVSHLKSSIGIGETTGKFTRRFTVNGTETDYFMLSSDVIFD